MRGRKPRTPVGHRAGCYHWRGPPAPVFFKDGCLFQKSYASSQLENSPSRQKFSGASRAIFTISSCSNDQCYGIDLLTIFCDVYIYKMGGGMLEFAVVLCEAVEIIRS